ncbi:quinone oxidoreductase family protein [Mycolicibacterium neoaurum]|uniref:Zinc-binding alcohol dehydrogenase n=1 Tax=Mycolicibacterium neoaurum TaxID=1795 RepID=A0AAV2WMA0_MYCNE|nr:zinc-binding alcohol dehydrogenase family protein [Mycolicibacterium neoaurum]TLH57348.1 alcohol dehydrogenase [Mycolicibacterium neoaurum]CDQ45252.1 putative zinc-binding alcohol dehydrogenase [Mycolicibacterium neoaurum]
MKAAVIDQWGQPPRYADFPEPQPGDGTLTATVEASALTNLTKGIGNGTHYASREMRLPMVPGVDGVARLDDGRRVYTGAVPPYGMLAERTLLNAHDMVELPDGIDAVTAAAVPNPGISSWLALEHAAALRPGEHVLVLGATGVTGSLAAQLAASVFGAGRVVVAGRDTARLDWLRTVGADDIIDLRNDDVRARVHALHTAQPFDVVLDYLWGNPAAQVLAALADGPTGTYHRTRFIQVGAMADPTMPLPAAVLRSTGIQLSGVGIGSVPPAVLAAARTEALPRLFDMVGNGSLHMRTAARPLADITDAWTTADPSGTRVVLTP